MVGFSRFGPTPKYPNISSRFGRFLWIAWSDWADSFCIESGILRHKFRLPTWGIFETKNFRLFWHYTPFEGTWKNIFRWKKYFPHSPYIIGNLIRYLRNWNSTKRGEWDTLNRHAKSCKCASNACGQFLWKLQTFSTKRTPNNILDSAVGTLQFGMIL